MPVPSSEEVIEQAPAATAGPEANEAVTTKSELEKPAPDSANASTTPTDSTPAVKVQEDAAAIGPEVPSEPRAEPSRKLAVPEKKPPSKPRLVVGSWAGAYGEAQAQAIIAPLARELGFDIERRVQTGKGGPVDVTELDQSALMAACRSGAVIKRQSPPPRQDDFLANSITECGVPTFAWSSMLIANGEAMKKLSKRRYREPNALKHLLETKTYPGRRALIRSPKRLLEMMLMADGVGRTEVYDLLATRQGQDRAFKLLDGMIDDILWVDGPREALLALDQGNVTMAMTFSGRAFRRLIASRMRPIWDGHIIDFASWAVPANSPNRASAEKFILAATSTESLAAQARLWPYGPMRRSALPLARRHALLDTDLDAFMPTSDLRFGQGLVLSAAFWSEHGDGLQDRFDAWQAGVPLGIRVPIPKKAPPPPLPPLPRFAPKAPAPTVQ